MNNESLNNGTDNQTTAQEAGACTSDCHADAEGIQASCAEEVQDAVGEATPDGEPSDTVEVETPIFDTAAVLDWLKVFDVPGLQWYLTDLTRVYTSDDPDEKGLRYLVTTGFRLNVTPGSPARVLWQQEGEGEIVALEAPASNDSSADSSTDAPAPTVGLGYMN